MVSGTVVAYCTQGNTPTPPRTQFLRLTMHVSGGQVSCCLEHHWAILIIKNGTSFHWVYTVECELRVPCHSECAANVWVLQISSACADSLIT